MNSIFSHRVSYLLLYVAVISLYGFIIMGIDKWKAARRGRRIPEKTLFIAAFIGGAAGIYLGMKLFHHKTLHKKFKYGIPAVLVLNILVFGYIYNGYMKP